MSFYPGDVVFYRLTNRKYIVVKFYIIKHDNLKIELIDLKPLVRQKSDKFVNFLGYNSIYFELVKKESKK